MKRFTAHLTAVALLASLIVGLGAAPAAADPGGARQVALAGTGSPLTGPAPAGDGLGPEYPAIENAGAAPEFTGVINPSFSRKVTNSGQESDNGNTTHAKGAKSNPQVRTSFDGLDLFQQRYARRGNQFTVEPPDQALCVGNGHVVAAVNDVLNIFDQSGVSVLPDNTSGNVVSGHPTDVNHAVDLNSFYGYPAAIDRTTGLRGQFVTDPTCLYDAATRRFFLVVLTLETDPATGGFTTVNHLDLAVSKTPDPTGLWNIYRIDVTNDGTNPDPANACPCLGDYPHIGADAYGIYLTTNAYPWNGFGFNGAQIYALSKAQLAAGDATITMQHIDTFGAVRAPSDAGSTQPGFTVWPAQSPGAGSFDRNDNGTEYFLSSNAADEATHPVAGFGGTYVGNQIVVWALTNTRSLNGPTPNLALANQLLPVSRYAIAPKARQPGSGTAPTTQTPLGRCINDTTTPTIAGTGCWRLLFGAEPAHNEVIAKLDSNDTRMQQVSYANGKLWGSLDTAVTVADGNRAGVAWYVVDPKGDQRGGREDDRSSAGPLAPRIALQGILGMDHTDLIYPAIGVTASGKGVMALTLVGDTSYPSAAYAAIDARTGAGDVHVIASGATTSDGFTSYKSFVGNPPRTRWGDYGAAAVDGSSIWIASEYIAGSCDYATWGGRFFGAASGDNKLGTCAPSAGAAGPRTALGNWSTRISKLTP
ncbi:MAG TPA: hypothetical protein VGT60_04815 [Candidatus Limnocylindria bacterium]|nr:hypothetical protein [Candidatus Limnocylindria bacterium]